MISCRDSFCPAVLVTHLCAAPQMCVSCLGNTYVCLLHTLKMHILFRIQVSQKKNTTKFVFGFHPTDINTSQNNLIKDQPLRSAL